MGKRSNFERHDRDFYPTPLKAMLPLVPFLRRDGVKTFAEPCAGDGDLVRHLESFGLRCVYAGDIATGQNALAIERYVGNPDVGITNPPFKYPEDHKRSTRLLHDLIRHFLDLRVPFWLLLPHDWSANKGSKPYLLRCSDIVPIGRVKWIPNSEYDGGYENSCWYRFDPSQIKGHPVLHGRDQKEVIPARRRTCEQCGKAYTPQRSSSRFCSGACRTRACRQRS
ncbi:hypothetical protein [Bradyrhizobium sp. Leo170]|uniref:hypothetical protein n=1 Tax=Bradyrhizobium sp. Leo170 TaxID=1571199 RepID=UPI001A91954A|nr:hypothetical protein [Bradyrhizobium sp. Leo170]